MLENTAVFASFAVRDTEKARSFYQDKLGLEVRDGQEPGILEIAGSGGSHVLVYPKPDHQPATFTVLNIAVPDIDAAVDELSRSGVQFERYDTDELRTDEKGIAGGDGPRIAWFRDPDGNIVSVLQVPPA